MRGGKNVLLSLLFLGLSFLLLLNILLRSRSLGSIVSAINEMRQFIKKWHNMIERQGLELVQMLRAAFRVLRECR